MRDPRIDPRCGDALRFDCRPIGFVLREVDFVTEEGVVGYCVGHLGYDMTLDEWRNVSTAAEVVTVAGEVKP